MNRDHMLASLAREEWDLLVIGGGISGAGAAREASRRGLKVALVERGDFAGGTSSRSGKMIIGGLRYLLNREFHLVCKGIRERDWLAAAAPHLVHWTPYLFPVWAGDPDSLWKIRMGLTLYDLLGAGGSRRRHRHLTPEEARQAEPGLRREGLRGAAEYWDCMTDDARLVLETLQAAMQRGAAVANYAGVVQFNKTAGRIAETVIEDRLTGNRFPVRASRVLVAAGPWTDEIRKLDDPAASPLLRLVKGSFIVVPHERLPVQRNVTLRAPDKRMTFAVPYSGATYVGTTEVDHKESCDDLAITRPEVEYLLAAAHRAFPEAELRQEDILSTWAGLRPLVGSKPGQNPSQVKRDYTITTRASGLAVLAGGKLTGFRAMAEEVIDRLFPATASAAPRNAPAPFPGAGSRPPASGDFVRLAEESAVPVAWLRQRMVRYGARLPALAAELPAAGAGAERWLRAQTRFAVKFEMAQRLPDVLWRRTGVMIAEKTNGLKDAEVVAGEMAALLGWSSARVDEELRAYRAEVARMWSWREREPAPVTAVRSSVPETCAPSTL